MSRKTAAAATLIVVAMGTVIRAQDSALADENAPGEECNVFTAGANRVFRSWSINLDIVQPISNCMTFTAGLFGGAEPRLLLRRHRPGGTSRRPPCGLNASNTSSEFSFDISFLWYYKFGFTLHSQPQSKQMRCRPDLTSPARSGMGSLQDELLIT